MNINVLMKFVYIMTVLLILSIPQTNSNEPNKIKSKGHYFSNLAHKAFGCGKLSFIYFY